MRALVVYESMFGNTRCTAESIGRGLNRSGVEVTLMRAGIAPGSTEGFDVLVLGAPTHAHSLPRSSSRLEAAKWAADPAKVLFLEPSARDAGVREWLDILQVSSDTTFFATFSTRADIMRALAGDAAVAIRRRLMAMTQSRVHAECFLVDKKNRLLDGELERAEAWGAQFVGFAVAA